MLVSTYGAYPTPPYEISPVLSGSLLTGKNNIYPLAYKRHAIWYYIAYVNCLF